MGYYDYDYSGTYLMHHGIKGQTWGRRRFQNPDGSLTEEGRKRYGVPGAGILARFKKKKDAAQNDAKTAASTTSSNSAKTAEDAEEERKAAIRAAVDSGDPVEIAKHAASMSNEELRAAVDKAVERDTQMKRLAELQPKELTKTEKAMDAIETFRVATQSLSDSSNNIKNILDMLDKGKKTLGMDKNDNAKKTEDATPEGDTAVRKRIKQAISEGDDQTIHQLYSQMTDKELNDYLSRAKNIDALKKRMADASGGQTTTSQQTGQNSKQDVNSKKSSFTKKEVKEAMDAAKKANDRVDSLNSMSKAFDALRKKKPAKSDNEPDPEAVELRKKMEAAKAKGDQQTFDKLKSRMVATRKAKQTGDDAFDEFQAGLEAAAKAYKAPKVSEKQLYKILGQMGKAAQDVNSDNAATRQAAKKKFDDAASELDDLNETLYKSVDSKLSNSGSGSATPAPKKKRKLFGRP